MFWGKNPRAIDVHRRGRARLSTVVGADVSGGSNESCNVFSFGSFIHSFVLLLLFSFKSPRISFLGGKGGRTTCNLEVAVSVRTPPQGPRWAGRAVLVDSNEDAGRDRRVNERANTILYDL